MAGSDDVDEFLAHYGVKGMRWGVRKREDEAAPTNTKGLSLKNPKVRRAALIGASVAVIAGAAFVASRYADKPFDPAKVSRGAETAKRILQQPTDVIYMTKPHRGSGIPNTTLRFVSKGGTKDFFEIFDRAGLNSDSFGRNTIRKMTNGDLAVLFDDLLGRVDNAGRSVPHAVFIPANKASGLNSLEEVLEKFGPQLEAAYQAHLETVRRGLA